MKKNLLKISALAATITTALTGCGGGTDEGFNPNFSADTPLVISMPVLSAEMAEESGEQTIDLVAGVTVDGQPAQGNIVISDLQFTTSPLYRTPQSPSIGQPNQTISPFTVEGRNLVVDTDLFADRLSTCDTSDNFGSTPGSEPDGILDNPPSVTYTIDFAIDNGFNLQPGEILPRRILELTVNAIFDEVENVTAEPVRVSLGKEGALFATVLPQKACDQRLSYNVADESIATIDDNGNITTIAIGETTVTVTSLSNPELSTTVALEVFSEFTLNLTNKDTDENGLTTEIKTTPSCVSAGLYVEPQPASGETLTGEYTYEWSSSNDIDFPLTETIHFGEGGIGRFSTGDLNNVGSQFEASVAYLSGNTGTFPSDEVESKSATVIVEKNLMCEPGTSAHPAGFNTDFNLDGEGAPWKPDGLVTTVNKALSGNALEVTMTNANSGFTRILQQVFNKQRNWHSSTYGLGGASVGKTYKFAMWVKLQEMPQEEVQLRHVVLPFAYEGGPTGPGFDKRLDAAGIFTAMLRPTTEWQLIEFVDDATGSRQWSVPENWSLVTDVFVFYEFIGFPVGAKVLIDEYSSVEVQ
ncbi:Ig-like domain-containing protein [Alteromonas stellipolaris]|uniref:Ig-like domain-containing protein n=1 Tax=Alteromonas stellipolaris TaxID=233316 RepID=UPI0026E40B3E|nr:Ig-like domain-containing protein [Alteromonas stellipolaris]MDO6535547.1 Ig-like domain-containing protein [Alteromonas stellipolaris]MDO6627423.1 Ig-like domain-containing protein [Alteromonas stellipolaris]